MTTLLYHPNTSVRLEALVDDPKPAVLMLGEKGMGKHTAALELAARVIGLSPDKLGSYQYLKHIGEGQGTISIDEVRDLQRFIKLGVPGKSKTIDRLILIEESTRMTAEAQNALLKMLEEPPERTMFLLTATDISALLGTILSRVSIVPLLPVSQAQAKAYFARKRYEAEAISQAYAIAAGRPGLMQTLLSGASHPMAENIQRAKSILAETPGHRLLEVDANSKDKNGITELLEAFASITHAALHHAASQNKHESVKVWRQRQDAVAIAAAKLDRNANAKLVLDDLFLNL